MEPSPMYHPPEGEGCETSVENGLPLWAEPAVGCCSRRPSPFLMWGSGFVGAREVGPWVVSKSLLVSPLRGEPPSRNDPPTYLPTANLKHISERELTIINRQRRLVSFNIGDLVVMHHWRLPLWPLNYLHDPFSGPYRIIKINGSRIHVRSTPRPGGELLCAPRRLTYHQIPDRMSSNSWRQTAKEVKQIDLQNTAVLAQAYELEEMTSVEMAVDCFYMVAGIARQKYKQG